jgi:hypothetical protein
MTSIDLNPLTLVLVGAGSEPIAWQLSDEPKTSGVWSFGHMTLVERAALRALCEEAIRWIDRSGPQDAA